MYKVKIIKGYVHSHETDINECLTSICEQNNIEIISCTTAEYTEKDRVDVKKLITNLTYKVNSYGS